MTDKMKTSKQKEVKDAITQPTEPAPEVTPEPETEAIVPEILDNEEADTDTPPSNNLPVVANSSEGDPVVLTEDEIEEAANLINKFAGEVLWKTCINVGNYILETFFNNNIDLALRKDPTKSISFRKLRNYDLKIPFEALNQMVRVAAQEKLLIENMSEDQLKKISYSHRLEILKAQSDADKVVLAEKCATENLSVRELRSELRGTGKKQGSIEVTPWSTALDRLINEQDLSDESLGKMTLAKIKNIKSQIDMFMEQVESIKAKLEKLQPSIESVYNEKSKPKQKGLPKKVK